MTFKEYKQLRNKINKYEALNERKEKLQRYIKEIGKIPNSEKALCSFTTINNSTGHINMDGPMRGLRKGLLIVLNGYLTDIVKQMDKIKL